MVVIGATGHIGSYLVPRLDVAAEQAMTLHGLATGVARWFGREPALDFVDWAEFDRRVGPEHAEATRQHAFRSITASIARAQKVLGYAPRYRTLDALYEALTWLVANGQADVGGQQFPAPGLDSGEPGPPAGLEERDDGR